MNYIETDHRQACQVSRFIFAAGVVLLFSGTGLTLQMRTLASDDACRTRSTAVTDDKSEQDKMQGEWKVVRCEFGGLKDAQIVGLEHTIKGDKWIRPNRRTGEYQLKFDPTKDPKWVDLSAERLGDQTLKGIYLLDGDKLTICYAYDPELPRPKEFKTMAGDKTYIYELSG